MRIRYHLKFKKQYKKLPSKQQLHFDARLQIFLTDQTAPELRVHPLKGKYTGYWSMNVSGDIRALYYFEGGELVVFALIGTHSQLYG